MIRRERAARRPVGGTPLRPAVVACLLMLSAPAGAAPVRNDVDRAVAALRRNFAPLRDLSAEVTVETAIKGMLTEQTYRQRYRYAFRAPSSLRMDYLEPAGRPGDRKVLIARGRTVWVDGNLRQGAETPDEAASPVSLFALSMGGGSLTKDFHVKPFVEPAHQRLIGLLLTPKAKAAHVVSIKVWVDEARGVVEQTKVFGAEDVWLSTSGVSKFERFGRTWLPVEMVTMGCEARCKTTFVWRDVRMNRGLSTTPFEIPRTN